MCFLNTSSVLFSLKSYAGAMLALFMAFSIDLKNPYWAFISAYIISQPLTGAVLSKAVYRICGSFLGSAAAVILVPNFVNEPLLLSLILSLWISLCLYISLYDRTPRSYAFFLAGYTIAIVGFPNVNSPNDIFNEAVSRFEEITLGILGATLTHSLFFPQDVASVFAKKLDLWWQKVKKLIPEVLAKKTDKELVRDWQALASEVTQLYLLSTHLPFDTANLRNSSILLALDEGMATFLATIYVLADRFHAIYQIKSSELNEWIQNLKSMISSYSNQTEEQIDQLEVDINENSTWSDLLKLSLITNLSRQIKLYKNCNELRSYLFSYAKTLPSDRLARSYKYKNRPLHFDRQIAFLSFLAAFISTMSICLFWIATAWPSGPTAALLAAIACCFFASQVDPLPFLLSFMSVLLLSIPVAAFYLFVVLPRVNDFFMLVLVLSPFYLAAGILMAMPRMVLVGTAAVLSLANLMLYQNGYSAEFASFMNTSLALVIGIGTAALFNYLCRSFGKEWNIKRLLFAIRRDLAKMAASAKPTKVTIFTLRTVDRLGLLIPLKLELKIDRFLLIQGLRSLSIGQDICHLQKALSELPLHTGQLIRHLLDELAYHFRTHQLHHYDELSYQLLDLIDSALREVIPLPKSAAKNDALLGLCGLRRNLFPQVSTGLNEDDR